MAILQESVISLSDAAHRARVSLPTALRWVINGMKRDGTRIKLQAYRVGGRWRTSEEALERFLAALNPDMPAQQPAARAPGVRRRASEQAAAQLAKIGI